MRHELNPIELAHYHKQTMEAGPKAELARIIHIRQKNLIRLMTMPDSELNIVAEIPFAPLFL